MTTASPSSEGSTTYSYATRAERYAAEAVRVPKLPAPTMESGLLRQIVLIRSVC